MSDQTAPRTTRGINLQPRSWRRFAALGDSFTEGLMDATDADGRHVGWADLVAGALAARATAEGDDGVLYANLAVRGRLVGQVVAEQVPAAIALAPAPDLVSIAVGVNDSLRRHFDVNDAATELENGVRELRRAGIEVLVFAFGDPARRSRLMGAVRTRIERYNSAVEAVAHAYGCYRVSFWEVAAFDDDRFWDEDRLHLSPDGHVLAALCALEALGLGDDQWRTPIAPTPRPRMHRRAAGHAHWVRAHFAPWAIRRARGISSGDSIEPKRPAWTLVTEADPRVTHGRG